MVLHKAAPVPFDNRTLYEKNWADIGMFRGHNFMSLLVRITEITLRTKKITA